MWDLIKHKAAKLGCFITIAFAMLGATFLTRLVLGWFHYDAARSTSISNAVGDYVGDGLLGLTVFLGFLMMGRQLIKELRERSSRPPRPRGPPQRVPPIRRGFQWRSRQNPEHERARH